MFKSLNEVHAIRNAALDNKRCAEQPFGCGEPVAVDSFRDTVSVKEYSISGLCQTCQDAVFGVEEQ